MTPQSDHKKKVIAFFDFDGTLAHSDSLWPFLIRAAGWGRFLLALACATLALMASYFGPDRRTAFKKVLLSRSLGGLRIEQIDGPARSMAVWPRWIESTVAALRRHHEQGHEIIIATGGLQLYVPFLVSSLPVTGILATEMEVKDGLITGVMLTGNCVRKNKAERVAAYLAEHGPYDEIWAYGNAPHDLPMMAHAHHTVIV